MNRHLYRCRQNRILAGVAGGVAEFFGIDATLVRVLWFISVFFGGFSILLYIGLALVVPLEPTTADAGTGPTATDATPGAGGLVPSPSGHLHQAGAPSVAVGGIVTVIGIVLIAVGALALFDMLMPHAISWRYVWPVAIVGVGAALIIGAFRRGSAAG